MMELNHYGLISCVEIPYRVSCGWAFVLRCPSGDFEIVFLSGLVHYLSAKCCDIVSSYLCFQKVSDCHENLENRGHSHADFVAILARAVPFYVVLARSPLQVWNECLNYLKLSSLRSLYEGARIGFHRFI